MVVYIITCVNTVIAVAMNRLVTMYMFSVNWVIT